MKKSIRVLGCGSMGGALVRGLLASELKDRIAIKIFDIHQERLSSLATHSSITALSAPDEGPLTDDAIILCVKPYDLSRLGAALAGKLTEKTLVISILAGTPIATIARELQFEHAIVRAMPNVAATVLTAATVLSANERCSSEQQALTEAIFKAVGEAYWTKESLMDAVTGLSGSGPAYIYMVIEALTDGGVKMGLPRDLSLNLSVQTVLGAAKLVKETGLHPAILKDQVTTPGGTTITALHELEAHGLRSMFVSAVVTATERSRYLGQQNP